MHSWESNIFVQQLLEVVGGGGGGGGVYTKSHDILLCLGLAFAYEATDTYAKRKKERLHTPFHIPYKGFH